MTATEHDPARMTDALERLEARLAALETGIVQRLAKIEAAVEQAGRRRGYYLGDHTALSVMENGQMLLVDTRSRDIAMRVLATGRWEHNETTAFSRLIRPGDTVFDVGANHGVFALLAGPRCRPGGQVHAFEPNPDLARLITMSTWLNGLQHLVKVHTLAASDAEGEAVLTASEAYSGGGSLRQRRAAAGFAGSEFRSIACRTVRLDGMFPDPTFRIDVMKIDVEGFEGRVLRGMPKLLERSPGLRIVMEFGPQMMKEAGVPATEVAAMLQGLGFSAWGIGPGGALTPMGWDALAEKTQGLQNLVVARERPY
ncbi:FkbM family methyltransferase [Neoroseomonas soli]|uniref:FkbM family methyltransferase n=1 Tax=Neoroseomonas soli TaxID=1081025 RepID=A0A9X9X313_9PROT|nr:FkbM family methyltransferase [Neoroseomonas soli]